MRFTSHLDLQRTWERTLRRAGLPIAYSEGFSPRARINLAAALPLGFTSDGEILDTWLDCPLPLDQVLEALVMASPPGIEITGITEVEPRLPALQATLRAADYLVSLAEPVPDLSDICFRLLAETSLPRTRRGKPYDLRPLIIHLAPGAERDPTTMLMTLAAQEGATGRPEEVVAALELTPDPVGYHRLRLTFTIEP
jgi:radical SAM-linked protein